MKLEVEHHGESALDQIVAHDSILGLPGTLASGQYSLTAVAIEDSEVAFVDRVALLELMKTDNSELGLELIRLLGEEVIRTREVLSSRAILP